jgi:phosphoadenosine phosphosulfate reductase
MDFLGIDSKYENLLWVDKRAYRGFDKDMNMIKYGRSLEKLPQDISNLITHNKFCDIYYDKNIKDKVEYEKDKFKEYLLSNNYEEYVISVSGGKDSTVCGEISMQALDELGIDYRILFGNTSNETHFTYQYVKKTYGGKLEIANPSEGFYQWCKRNKFIPTRFGRACCSVFKEGNIGEYLNPTITTLHILGMRRDESKTRSEYKQVRKGKWKEKMAQENWDMYLPIIEFNDLDIWSYLIANNIEYNQLYKFGYGRVGCTNCPYRNDYELKLNKYFLPKYDKEWKKILIQYFKDTKQWIYKNCTVQEFLDGDWRAGVVREVPTDEVILEFADYMNITYEKASKYFKQNRCDCGKGLSGDMIALNMKLLGRETNARMCLKCLAEFLGTTKAKLKEEIERFKDEGCNLF